MKYSFRCQEGKTHILSQGEAQQVMGISLSSYYNLIKGEVATVKGWSFIGAEGLRPSQRGKFLCITTLESGYDVRLTINGVLTHRHFTGLSAALAYRNRCWEHDGIPRGCQVTLIDPIFSAQPTFEKNRFGFHYIVYCYDNDKRARKRKVFRYKNPADQNKVFISAAKAHAESANAHNRIANLYNKHRLALLDLFAELEATSEQFCMTEWTFSKRLWRECFLRVTNASS
ncbi:hypothetical protein [Vibrio mediterranei]|uniref:hypothetical protein n=1 Tax=Vibrio mediterranei TaxID=689 RepID=UPI0040697128